MSNALKKCLNMVIPVIRHLEAGMDPSPAKRVRDFRGRPGTSTNNSHASTHLLQHFQRSRQLIACMCSGHDGPQASLAFGDRGISDPRREDPFFEQLAAELHGQAAFADDDGRDRRLTGWSVHAADVETEPAQLFLEEAGVLPEFFDPFRLLLQHIEGGNTGGGDGWWLSGREQEGPPAMVEKIDQVFRAADVTTHGADGLR